MKKPPPTRHNPALDRGIRALRDAVDCTLFTIVVVVGLYLFVGEWTFLGLWVVPIRIYIISFLIIPLGFLLRALGLILRAKLKPSK